MSLPGLALPGLVSASSTPLPAASAPISLAPPRTEELTPRSELRFEVAHSKPYKVRLTRGSAEIFGTELAPNVTYNLSGHKAAIFTWQGCALEIQGDAESEYVGTETEAMNEWINLHGMLESMRDEAIPGGMRSQDGGPRIMVIGSDANGKTSLVKCLTSWALKMGRTPTVVNLDAREGILGIPGSLTATTLNTLLDVEEAGWGSTPISGPTAVPVKTPLVYHYPFQSPDENAPYFKAVTTRAALAVTSKMEEDSSVKEAGLIIDTPGSLNQPKGGYDVAAHIISEFSVNVLVVLGSERLYNDMNRRFGAARNAEDAVTVLRISTTGGAISRDDASMRQTGQQQIRSYFFGDSRAPLNPHSQTWDFSELSIYRPIDPAAAQNSISFLPGMDDDDVAPGSQDSSAIFERVSPMQGMANNVLAIKFASGNAAHESIRDSCVMGYVYVAEVDDARKKVRFLAPHPSRWGDRALVWGQWPEGMSDIGA